MAGVDDDLRALLRGEALPGSGPQGEALMGNGPNTPNDVHIDVNCKSEFVPIAKESMGYIVVGLVFNDAGEVLMMQEAKSSCYGRWYLPAGRMEVNETIQEAVAREVKEETGVDVEPTTLISVEVATGVWFRFTMTCKVTGGKPKTTAEKDSESLQARWVTPEQVRTKDPEFPLRANDILPLIKAGEDFIAAGETERFPDTMPVLIPHTKLILRLLLVHQNQNEPDEILVALKPTEHIPQGLIIDEDFSLYVSLFRLLADVFGKVQFSPTSIGVLSVEHYGKPAKQNDGFCLSVLFTTGPKCEKKPDILKPDNGAEKYAWRPVTDPELGTHLKSKLKKGMTINLMYLR